MQNAEYLSKYQKKNQAQYVINSWFVFEVFSLGAEELIPTL